MPTIKSSKKRMELSRKWEARNRAKRTRVRNAIKKVREAEDPETGQELLREAISLLDRAATKGLMHSNRVNRIKSQLHRHVNQLEEDGEAS